jgi:hypothetical protein
VRLHAHLFPGDGDEHGAVLAVGVAESERETRLLVREVFLAREGVDYVPGRHGYRALTAEFVARVSNHCAREGLGYLAVHCHGGDDAVEFSQVDRESHQRGYPALLDITRGGPVGALVFAQNAVAGEIWLAGRVQALDSASIIGVNVRCLFPSPPGRVDLCDEMYHRQSLLFGAVGQQRLAGTKVAIIGLGGVGSLINEWLARLGVGEIIAIDYDRVEPTNRPRIVGSTRFDALDFLFRSRFPLLQRLGARLATLKVKVAKRVARAANPSIRYRAIPGNITSAEIADQLRDVDYIFLCADSMQSRLVFNALVHQYLIPGVQIGSKVPVNEDTGEVGDVFAVSRLILPEARGGCLWCNQLISATKLQEEALSPDERRRQAYVSDRAVSAPSVITLNALGAAQAANDFLFGLLGLHDRQATPGYRMHFARPRVWRNVECAHQSTCLHCGAQPSSVFARGDRATLPCRVK